MKLSTILEIRMSSEARLKRTIVKCDTSNLPALFGNVEGISVGILDFVFRERHF